MRLIDLDKLLKAIHNTPTTYDSDEYPLATQLEGMAFRQIEILELIEKQPIVNKWNKLTFRPLTEEEEEDYSNQEWTYIIDGLPDLGEEVLVTDGKYVWIDSFDIDDSVYLSGTDNEVDRVKAWMELPKYIEPKKELNQTDLMMLEIESRRERCTFVDKSLRFSVEVCKLDPFIPSPKDFMKELRKIIKKHENEYRG